ncbi:MAG: hypothetical protein CVU77_06730 [Elusimicrobia bacterium HGW-Elusimicrobia-1]|jgi:chromosome segregation ATPase|nr:MAG: hypothetical protein CVU77_06730 [Elusimicrobia bacterium HGW-Elusimicrobia-1]
MWKRSQSDKTPKAGTAPAASSSQNASSSDALSPRAEDVGAEELAKIKASVEDQIAKIERFIDAERKAYQGRAEHMEEEKARLSAHMELTENDLSRNLSAQSETISSMRRKWGADISNMEAKISAEEKIWENKLNDLAAGLENMKLSSRVEAEGSRAETDSAVMSIKSEIRTLESRLAELVARRRAEGSLRAAEIKKRQEDIAAIKAQISLKAGQLRLEEERFECERAELDEKYRIRAKELEDKLSNLRAESQKAAAAKQDELLAFETAVKQRGMRFEQEADSRKASLDEMRRILGSRIKDIEAEMSGESGRCESVLKEREEILDKIKVELMLSDTAADSERQNRLNELSELKARAERQLGELAKKYEQEKNDWDKKLSGADRRMEAARIEAQVKMREMTADLDRARADIEREKKKLSARVLELENEMMARRIDYEKSVSAKSAELEELKNRLASEQERKASEYHIRLDELSARKNLIENELAAAAAARRESVKIYASRIEQKNAEMAALRSEHERELAAASAALEREKNSIKEELAPVNAELSAVMARKDDLDKRHAASMAALAERQDVAGKEADERIKELSAAHAAETARIKYEIERLENELKLALDEKSRIESEAVNARRAISDEKIALDGELAELRERSRQEMDRLSASAAEEKAKISSDIENLERDSADAAAAYAAELASAEEAVAAARKELEINSAAISAKLTEDRAALERRISALSEEVAARREDIKKIKSSAEGQLSQLRGELADSKKALEAAVVAAREDYRVRSAQYDSDIDVMKSRAADLARRFSELKKETVDANSDAVATVRRLREELEGLERKNEAEATRLRGEYERENSMLADEVEKIEAEAAALKIDHENAIARLREELEKNETLRAQKIAERKTALDRLDIEHKRLSERYNAQINSFKADMADLEGRLPAILTDKEKQIADLTAKLAAADERHAGQKESYVSAHAQFVSRAESRRDTLRKRIDNLKEKHATELADAASRLAAAQNEFASKENELRNAYEQKERMYKAENSRLDKIREELEKTLRDQTTRGRDEIKGLDKKIYELEAQLAHREKANQEEIARILADNENEQKRLSEEALMLRGNIGDIMTAGAAAVSAKNEEITFTASRQAAALENLLAEINGKENQWKEANSRLEQNVAVVKEAIENQRADWEKLKEAKEKELAELGSKIANWEYDVEQSRASVRKEHDLAVARFQKEIAAAAASVDSARRSSESAMAAKQSELKKLEDDYAVRRDAVEGEWRRAENELLKARETLQAELSSKESAYRENTAAAAREIAALEKEIEDRKLRIALAASEFESIKINTQRENKRTLKKLESEAASLLEKYAAYNDESVRALASSEEKIALLAKRLVTRDERMRNEIVKRREDAERYLAGLRDELEEAASSAVASGTADVRRIESLREELALLETEFLKTKAAVEEERNSDRMAETEESLKAVEELEKIFEDERSRFAELLEAKMSKIDELEQSLGAASNDILAESARRRAFMDNLKSRGARLAYKLRYFSGGLANRGDRQQAASDDDGNDDKNK